MCFTRKRPAAGTRPIDTVSNSLSTCEWLADIDQGIRNSPAYGIFMPQTFPNVVHACIVVVTIPYYHGARRFGEYALNLARVIDISQPTGGFVENVQGENVSGWKPRASQKIDCRSLVDDVDVILRRDPFFDITRNIHIDVALLNVSRNHWNVALLYCADHGKSNGNDDSQNQSCAIPAGDLKPRRCIRQKHA